MNKLKRIIHLYSLIICLVGFTSCDEEVSRTEPEDFEFVGGKIFVNSDPPGSQIFLDGKNYGLRTPDTLLWIENGIHQITLKRNYFLSKDTIVEISNEEIVLLFYDYYSDPQQFGKIYCTSHPRDCEIYLDEINTNQLTPVTLNNILPGEHTIRLKKELHLDRVVNCIVTAQKTTGIVETLVDTSVFVNYNKEYFNCPEDLQKIVIEDINRNCLWIGSRSGLLKFKNLQWTQFIGEEYYLHSNIISTIKLDKTNNLWIGTLKGLVKFDGTSWYDFSPNIGNSIVSSIDFDSQGNAWIATRNGLYKFNGVNWTHFHRGNSRLSSNYLSCVAVDNNDVIWIGTETWGLWTYYNNTFDSLSGYLFSSISCLEITQDNRIFVGHYMSSMSGTYGGISIYDGNNWTSYYDNITRPAISDIAVSTKNNNIWAATTKGLLLIDNKNQKTFFRIDNSGLPSDKTNSVIIDKDDNLWITTSDKGLTKFRKGDLLKIGY